MTVTRLHRNVSYKYFLWPKPLFLSTSSHLTNFFASSYTSTAHKHPSIQPSIMEIDTDDYQTEAYDYNDYNNEPRPDSVVYTQIFRDLKDLNKEAAELLREPLINSKFQNAITHGLKQEIAKRTKEDFPDEVTFAVVGDMKAGMLCSPKTFHSDADT